jgi:hypothetical protein
MVVPPTLKPTCKAEALAKAPPTIASSCEENAALKKLIEFIMNQSESQR